MFQILIKSYLSVVLGYVVTNGGFVQWDSIHQDN